MAIGLATAAGSGSQRELEQRVDRAVRSALAQMPVTSAPVTMLMLEVQEAAVSVEADYVRLRRAEAALRSMETRLERQKAENAERERIAAAQLRASHELARNLAVREANLREAEYLLQMRESEQISPARSPNPAPTSAVENVSVEVQTMASDDTAQKSMLKKAAKYIMERDKQLSQLQMWMYERLDALAELEMELSSLVGQQRGRDPRRPPPHDDEVMRPLIQLVAEQSEDL
jgi:hypothetical protein